VAEGRIYSYGGRQGTADPKFVNGDCAMYIQSSALISGFSKSDQVRLGHGRAAALGRAVQEGDSIIGGATLWVLKGKPRAEYGAWRASSNTWPSPSSRCGGTSTRVPGHLQHRGEATSSRATTS
jgi:hypothetical protein